MKNIVSIILEAQKQLVLKPIDLAHDITHHYRVYERSLKINNNEKLNADENLLVVCAWYHDLGGRRGENIDLLRGLLSKNTNDVNFINKSWDFISSSVNSLASFPSISINACILDSAASFRLIFSLIGPAGKKL